MTSPFPQLDLDFIKLSPSKTPAVSLQMNKPFTLIEYHDLIKDDFVQLKFVKANYKTSCLNI